MMSRVDMEADIEELRAALEKCRDELLGADLHVESATWKQGIRQAILQAEKALGVK